MAALEEARRGAGKTLQEILPDLHPPGEVIYQKISKFLPNSSNNLRSYTVLGRDDEGLIYLVHPCRTVGFVVIEAEMDKQRDVAPVLRVSLRDTDIKGYKQAYHLRIRKTYSRSNVAKTWYSMYVAEHSGIVSDTQYPQGDHQLWKSLLRHTREGFKVSRYKSDGTYVGPVSSSTPESEIWSAASRMQDTLLVLEKRP